MFINPCEGPGPRPAYGLQALTQKQQPEAGSALELLELLPLLIKRKEKRKEEVVLHCT